MAGGFGGMPVGGAQGHGSQGIVGGRRLASEPGGVVGNPRQSAVGGTFTPGGSGLTRAPGAVRGNGPGQDEEPRTRRSDRPDYLVEDEETWRPAGGRNTAPPVIE
jgi:hypothetical protein